MISGRSSADSLLVGAPGSSSSLALWGLSKAKEMAMARPASHVASNIDDERRITSVDVIILFAWKACYPYPLIY